MYHRRHPESECSSVDVTEYAKTLPNVVHAEENLYTCSADTQLHIAEKIAEHGLNRIVVASCTPRTHEPLFQETLKDAGLNKYLFEMANIRDQCSWVHAGETDAANHKAADLVRMAVARAARLMPLTARSIEVTKSALVIGGGVSGMCAALSLASQGFLTSIVEKEADLGGNIRQITMLEDGTDLIKRTTSNPQIQVFTNAELLETKGHVGRFVSQIKTQTGVQEVPHGVAIVAMGALPYFPKDEYQFGNHPGIVTQLDIEQMLSNNQWTDTPKQVVMIQCVGSRQGEAPVCSRVCCTQAVKNAIRIKTLSPFTEVFVFYRDIRTYGLREILYRDARKLGVLFVRYTPESPPIVSFDNEKIEISAMDLGLKTPLTLNPNLLVLSTGIRPANDAKSLATLLKLPLGQDGFFSEAHMKLRPVDVAAEGFFLAGLAHGPKLLDECISQAQGAAARAATVLAKDTLLLSAEVSTVDQTRCVGCLTCVRSCPYNVPKIGQNHTAEIEPAACQGCGICAAACPRKAIVTSHSTDDQILAKVEALFDRGGAL
jgi:heterodisulfide reductase subunit A-like polyferredoxin